MLQISNFSCVKNSPDGFKDPPGMRRSAGMVATEIILIREGLLHVIQPSVSVFYSC